MSSPQSFTGRTRRRRTSWAVRAMDKLAHGLIVGGGIGTIVAVSMVCVFLLWVVLPLFQPASLSAPAATASPWGARKLLHLASDEYRVAAWALLEDGTLDVFKLGGRDGDGQAANEQMESRKLFADGPAMTAAAFSLTSEDAALGFADGSIRVGTIGFVTRFIDEDQLGETARNLKPGEAKVVDSGLIHARPKGNCGARKSPSNSARLSRGLQHRPLRTSI